ncbi:MAG: hypothetical protein AAGK37_05235 [Pseudomonadota bacterium]
MQRLVLAVIIVAALVATVTVVATVLRQTVARGGTQPAAPGNSVQVIAYTLLLGLIVYVSFAGGD